MSDRDAQPAVDSVAEDYLALLGERGVDHLYVGAGTDTAPLVEAYARAQLPGAAAVRYPRPVVAVHENLAVGMAHGYTMVTGRLQAVMLHVSVGAANAVCAIMNAARAQVPMLFTAGRTPLYDRGRKGARNSEIHWAQEMFDQAGMVRELVKWDYELRDGLQLRDIVERALTIAQAHPPGPVSLTLPREVLAQPAAPRAHPAHESTPALTIPRGPAPDAGGVRQIAQAFARARCPVIVCTASGADPATVAPLVALCERFGIGVAEANGRVMNFPTRHPLHLGRSVAELAAHADALLFLESDVPWLPGRTDPPAGTFIAHAGTDPLFARYPSRTFRSDVTLTTTVAALLPALSAALEQAGAGALTRREHVASVAAQLAAVRGQRWKAAVGDDDAPINKAFLSQCINAFKPADAIVVNEYSLQRDGVDFDLPGTYFGLPPSAGLGWGMPAALGAQQAAPARMVIGIFGDGAYLFANPAACHQAAEMHGLPVLTVIYNNECWGAVQSAALGVYPDSHTAAMTRAGARAPLASIAPVPDFERYVQASRGHGERVTERAQLLPALDRAAQAVAQGRQALLNVMGV